MSKIRTTKKFLALAATLTLLAAALGTTPALKAGTEPETKPASSETSAPCSPDEKVKWMEYEQAVKASKQQARPALLFFHRPNCRQCELLEKNGFDRPDIACYINQKFAPASVNTRKRDDIRIKRRVTAAPTVWFISDEGAEIDYFVGYMNPDRLKLILRYVGDGVYKEKAFEVFEKEESGK